MEDKRQQTDEALGGLFGNSSLFSGLPSGVDTAAIQKPPTSDIGDSGPMSGESSSDNYNINVNVTQNLVQKEVEKKVNGILNTTSDANQIKKNYTGQSSVNDIQSTFIESPNFNRTLYTSNNSSSSNNQSINENLAISSDTINDKPYQNAFGGNKNSLFTSSVNNYTTGTSTSSNTANNTASHHYVNPNSPEGRVTGVKNQTSNFNYVNPNSPEGRVTGVDTNPGVETNPSNFNYVNPNSPEGRIAGVETNTSTFNYVNPNSPEGRIAGVENQTSDRSVKNTDKTAANPATTPVVVATAPPAVAAPVILPKPSKKPSNPTNNKSKVIRNSTDASSPTHNTKTNNSRIERGKANNAAKAADKAAKKIARDSQNPDSKTFVGPQQEPVVGPPAPKPEPNPNAGKRRTDTPADVDASNKALSINKDWSFNIPEKTTRTSTSPKLTNDVGNRPYINPNSPEGRIAGVDKPEFSIGTSSTGNPIVTGGSYKNPNSPEGRLLEDDTINIDGTMKDTDKFGPKTLDAAKRLAKEDTAKVEGELRATDINQNGSMPTDIAGVETAKPNISTTTNNDNGETTNETNNQSTTNAPSSSQTTNITNEVHNHHYVNPNSPEGRIANMDKPQFSIGTSSTGTPIVTGGSYKNPNSPEGRIAGVEVNKNSSITTNTSNNTASHNNTSNNTASHNNTSNNTASHSNTNNSRIERGKANNAAKAADKAAKKIARDSQNPDSKTFVGPQQEPVVGPPAPKAAPNPNAGKRRTDTPADIDASGKPLSINEDGSFNISSEAKSQADDNRKSMSDARTQDTERSRRLNVSPNQRVEGFDSSGKTSKANPNFNYKNPNSPEGRLLADDTINPNGSMKDTDKFGPKTLDAAKRLAKEDTARVTKEVTPIVENQLKKEAADITQNGSMPTDIAGVETAKPNISTTTNNDTLIETNNEFPITTPSSSNTTNTNTYNQNYVTNDESLSMYSNTAQYSDPSETYNQLSNIDYTNTDDEYTNNNTQVDSTAFIDSYTQGDATDFNVNLDSNSSDTTIEGVSNDANVNSISRPYNDTILDDGNSNSEPNTPSSSSSPVSSVSSSQQNNNTTINNGNQNISNTSSNITNGNVTINQSTTQQNTTNNIGGTTNSTSTSGTMFNGFNQNNSVDSISNSNQNYGNIRHNTTINAMLGGQSTTHALLSSYNDTIGIDNSESNQINISNNSTDAFNDNSQSNQSSFNNNQSASINTSNPSYTNNNFNSNQTSYTGDTNNTTNRFSNSVEFDGINNLFKSDYSTKISNISRSSTLTDTNENIKQIIREIISEESEKTKQNEEYLNQDMDTSPLENEDDVQFMNNQSAATDNINTSIVNDYSSLMDIMEKISSPPSWRTAIG